MTTEKKDFVCEIQSNCENIIVHFKSDKDVKPVIHHKTDVHIQTQYPEGFIEVPLTPPIKLKIKSHRVFNCWF